MNHKFFIQPLMILPEDKLCSSTSIKKKKTKFSYKISCNFRLQPYSMSFY